MYYYCASTYIIISFNYFHCATTCHKNLLTYEKNCYSRVSHMIISFLFYFDMYRDGNSKSRPWSTNLEPEYFYWETSVLCMDYQSIAQHPIRVHSLLCQGPCPEIQVNVSITIAHPKIQVNIYMYYVTITHTKNIGKYSACTV